LPRERIYDVSAVRILGSMTGSNATNELERAYAFLDLGDERTAERLVPTRFGPAVVHSGLPRVHDLNFVRVERPDGASAEELAREAERVQGAVPGIRHRRVNIRSAEARQQLEPQFRALGWVPQRFVVMVHRREPDRPAQADVHEVNEATLRPVWTEAIRSEPHGRDEDVVRQILEHRRLFAEAVPTRFFAAACDGVLAAYAELYSEDGTGQIEDVVTLPAYRGRGLARALVLRALAESKADGNDLTFLVADADDWPQQLYVRLGFEIVGRYARFLLEPA
jgi:ribosomal protein S18 acetylase RimI-like enzyme